MPQEKAPAFQFYPKDFLTDEKVVLMSNTEVGIYVRLLCFCWLEGTLPLETHSLAHMARMPVKQFTRVWEHSIVRTCFRVAEDGRLHHKRLDAERDKQDQFKRRQSDNGKLGGRPKKATENPDEEICETQKNPSLVETEPKKSSSSAVSDLHLQTPVNEPPLSVSSKRPIYQSDRFVVFEWQLTELGRTLGAHFEGFDLHAFFDDLSQQSRSSGLVIPSGRDARWAWLQARVEEEAIRRGLPMARANAAPTNQRIANLMRGGQKALERMNSR